MQTIGNVLWLILAGIWLALGYVLAGAILCITIIGIPFGVQAFKLAGFSLWPYGRRVVPQPQRGCLEMGFNILRLILFCWALFLLHIVAGVLLCITIIGIPFGVQAFKLSVLALWPFGRQVLPTAEAEAAGHVVLLSVPGDPSAR